MQCAKSFHMHFIVFSSPNRAMRQALYFIKFIPYDLPLRLKGKDNLKVEKARKEKRKEKKNNKQLWLAWPHPRPAPSWPHFCSPA